MKRAIGIGVIVVLLAGLLGVGFLWVNSAKIAGCAGKHADNLLGCLVAGPVAISVQVTGNVDQVSFYSEDDSSHPVVTIATNGKDATQIISLPTSSRYFFEVKKGSEVYRGRTVGFDTNQAHAVLSIRALNQYEGW